jgi:hypothetical protein
MSKTLGQVGCFVKVIMLTIFLERSSAFTFGEKPVRTSTGTTPLRRS